MKDTKHSVKAPKYNVNNLEIKQIIVLFMNVK